MKAASFEINREFNDNNYHQQSPKAKQISGQAIILELFDNLRKLVDLTFQNSKQKYGIIIVFILYCCSNWSLALINRKGYQIDIFDVFLLIIAILAVKTWLSGQGMASFLNQLSAKGQLLFEQEIEGGNSNRDDCKFKQQNNVQSQKGEEEKLFSFEQNLNTKQKFQMHSDVSAILKSFKIQSKNNHNENFRVSFADLQTFLKEQHQFPQTFGKDNSNIIFSFKDDSSYVTKIDQFIEQRIKKCSYTTLNSNLFQRFFDATSEIVRKNQNYPNYQERPILNSYLNVSEILQDIQKEVGIKGIVHIFNLLGELQSMIGFLRFDESNNLSQIQIFLQNYIKDQFNPSSIKKQQQKLLSKLTIEKDKLIREQTIEQLNKQGEENNIIIQESKNKEKNLANLQIQTNKDIEENSREKAELIDKIGKAQDQMQELSKQLALKEKQIQQTSHQECQQRELEGSAYLEEIKAEQNRVTSVLEDQLRNFMAQIEIKEKCIDEVQKQFSEVKQQNEEIKDSFEKQKEEKEILLSELNELKKKYFDLSIEITDLKSNLPPVDSHPTPTPDPEEQKQEISIPVLGGTEELSLRKTNSMNVSIQILEKSVRSISEVFYDSFRNTAYFNQLDLIAEMKQLFGEQILGESDLSESQAEFIIKRFQVKFLEAEDIFLNNNFGGVSEQTSGNKKLIFNLVDKNFEILKTRLNKAKDIADIQQTKITNEAEESEASRLVDDIINGALSDSDDVFNRQLISLKKIIIKYKTTPNLKNSTGDMNASKKKLNISSIQVIKQKIENLLQYIAVNIDNVKSQMKSLLSQEMRRTLQLKVKEWKKSQDDKNQVMKRWSLQSQNMWFTLIWHDGNDLDLVVKCPCGQQIFSSYFSNLILFVINRKIYYGTKKCDSCGTYLEIDMNAGANKNDKYPIEHVYLQKPPKIESQWEVYVKMFHCNNNKDSYFTIQIEHEDGRIQSFQGTLDIVSNNTSPTYKYTVGKGIGEQERSLIQKIRSVIDNHQQFSFE